MADDITETWTLADLTETERRHPLATRRGIYTFVAMLGEAMVKARVRCRCGWTGYRKGGILFAAEKPCPRCGAPVAVDKRMVPDE